MHHESYERSHVPEGGPEQFGAVAEAYKDAHECAVEIAGRGSYEGILDALRAEGLLAEEVKRVEGEYALDTIPFMNERDREMFAVLDLYDSVTARHCFETYKIAREKMEKEILPGVSFAGLIEKNEHVTLDQFYRACLFHDIGKVEVPRAVINSRLDFSCAHLTPARQLLLPSELAEIQAQGFSGEETLMDIVRRHEARSGGILEQVGYPIEAQLVALHHNYENKTPEHPFTVSVLHIDVDVADMVHIADVVQALRAEDRPYKGAFGLPKMMRVIAEHAQEGKVSPLAAYLWLTDDMRKYDAQQHEALDADQAEQEAHDLAFVRDFLARTAGEIGPIS